MTTPERLAEWADDDRERVECPECQGEGCHWIDQPNPNPGLGAPKSITYRGADCEHCDGQGVVG